MSPLCNSRMTS